MPLVVEEHNRVLRALNYANGGVDTDHPGDPLEVQHVAIGAASAQSEEFDSETRFLVVTTDEDCYFAIGADPTATSAEPSRFLPADTARVVYARGGEKIAVIEGA